MKKLILLLFLIPNLVTAESIQDYIDKISQSIDDFYKELSANPIHPKTSQPTPGDFRRQYQYLQSTLKVKSKLIKLKKFFLNSWYLIKIIFYYKTF